MLNIVITIVLTGFIGGALTFAWQRQQWLFQQRFHRLSATHDKQITSVRELFRLIHRRIFVTRMYADALRNGTLENVRAERAKYRDVVGEWSEQRPVLLMQIRVHYSYRIAIDLENEFQETFSIIDRLLRRSRIEFEDRNIRNEVLLSEVDEHARRMGAAAQNSMAELLRLADINKSVVEQRPKIYEDNYDDLTCLYLLQSLFKPRQYS